MTSIRNVILISLATIFFSSCSNNNKKNPITLFASKIAKVFQSFNTNKNPISLLDTAKSVSLAKDIESSVTPTLDSGLTLKLWGVDPLVADPVSINIDNQGRLYYTRTIRQKDAELDIRFHEEWEIPSLQMINVEDKRAFLHKTLSKENSSKNNWLKDLNKDGFHDWRDMTVQKEQVYRLEDINGDGVADKSTLVVNDFNEEVTDAMGGILKYGDDLFVGIAPDLWRIKENADGSLASKTSISHGYGVHFGFAGHGMSGLRVGPEGKIYWQVGDIGFSGKDKEGKQYDFPNSGVIVRSNPDGSDFEVFAYGNRNTHEFVFDEYGNMISEDNDGDHKGERERLVYVVNGGDIGWRNNWQYGKYRDSLNNSYKVWMDEKMDVPRWDGQAAYFLPTIANFVNGPCGMLYNPGTALGPKYKNTFFVAEFVGNPTKSGIHAFHLKPKGATFDFVDSKKILGGILGTGLDFGPDGAMYVADWIEGWDRKDYGRIWKLDVANPDWSIRKNTEQLIKADFKTYTEDNLQTLLKHADMRVRQKAQFELANRGKKGLEILAATLKNKTHQLARVHAIWGISQFARTEISNASLLVPYLKDSDPEIRAQVAKWIGDVRFKDAGNALIPLLKDTFPRARFFAAEALGRIAFVPAIQPIINMLAANNNEDNYLRHAGSLALSRIGKAEPLIALASHPSKAVRIAAVVALRRMQDPGIRIFLKDADEFVVTETARAINDDLSITDALPNLAESLNDHRFSNEPLIRRAINANLRVGKTENLQNLLNYIQFEGAPTAMRNEAMDAISTWAKPSVLDRVDGRFRGEIIRSLSAVQQNSTPVLKSLLQHKNPSIRLHASQSLGKLNIKGGTEYLIASLKNDQSADVKIEALRSLAKLEGAKMEEAIKIALNDTSRSVRVVGLELLKNSNLSKDLVVNLLINVINTRSVFEKQAALNTLATLPLKNTEKVLTDLLDQFIKGTLTKEIQFELADAITASGSTTLLKKYQKLASTSTTDTLKAAYASAMYGGDPAIGKNIFLNSNAAQCVRCHAIDDYGGNVGPRLNGIANRLTTNQLLEALIEPSARIAPGYGMVTLELKNHMKLNGVLQAEKPQAYQIKIGGKSDTLVKKSDVLNKIMSPSSMPQMSLILSKKDIRNVIAYLSTLKED